MAHPPTLLDEALDIILEDHKGCDVWEDFCVHWKADTTHKRIRRILSRVRPIPHSQIR